MLEGFNLAALGTPAQIIAACALLGILIRQLVPWKQLTLNAEQQIRKELRDRIAELKTAHADVTGRLLKCETECNEHKIAVERDILGMQKQHLSEQLALVQTIADLFPDAPQLQLLIKELETGQRSVTYIGGAVEDAKTNGK